MPFPSLSPLPPVLLSVVDKIKSKYLTFYEGSAFKRQTNNIEITNDIKCLWFIRNRNCLKLNCGCLHWYWHIFGRQNVSRVWRLMSYTPCTIVKKTLNSEIIAVKRYFMAGFYPSHSLKKNLNDRSQCEQ